MRIEMMMAPLAPTASARQQMLADFRDSFTSTPKADKLAECVTPTPKADKLASQLVDRRGTYTPKNDRFLKAVLPKAASHAASAHEGESEIQNIWVEADKVMFRDHSEWEGGRGNGVKRTRVTR